MKVETYLVHGPDGPELLYREVSRRSWVRFYPNPGFLISVWGKRWHWCRARGWHEVEEP